MDIGTGIAVGCTVLGGVASVFKFFPSRNGYNKKQCEKDHKDITDRFEHIESERIRMEEKTDDVAREIASKLDIHNKTIFGVLTKIESNTNSIRVELSNDIKDLGRKVDDHIQFHVKNKV